MNIKPYDKTIRDLLGSKRQFFIPRFQREYSWEKKNYQEFFVDMMGNLIINSGKISADQYFLGTMLFIGNFTEGTEQVIHVVDGQQRLTTITILFSALSDRFMTLGEETFPDDGSIEHIVSEDEGDFALNVGNLILLEVTLNGDAGNTAYSDKISIYKKSTYPWIAQFVADHSEWNQSMIADRAKKLAEIYYQKIFNKAINLNI